MDICSEFFNVTLPDVGKNNTLTNKGILRMLQEIGCIHSATVGFGLNDSEKTGLFWILLNWKLKVFSRPVWNTKLKVNTWPSKHTRIAFYRDFEIFDDKNNLVAIATSKWVLFDFAKKSICKITEDIEKKYLNFIDKNVFVEPFEEKILEPTNSTIVSAYTIRKRDIDTNNHVNNLNYLDFAYEVIPDNIEFNNVEIMYKHEAKFGDCLNLFYSKENDYNIVSIKNSKTDMLNCIVKLY